VSITPEIDLQSYDTPHCPECGQDIDTWAVEKRAVERERDRIIKLLEDPYSLLGSSIAHWQFGCDNEAKLQAFEIIRGENK
jgi:hypothetical protein